MYLVKELFDWVTLQTGLVPGVEWQCAYMPVEQDGAFAVLLERPGDPMLPTLRHNLGRFNFQVLSIGPTGSDYWAAYDLARRIFNVMGDRAGAELGDGTYTPEWYAEVIEARSAPYYLGGDERFRFEISTDYVVLAQTAQLMA